MSKYIHFPSLRRNTVASPWVSFLMRSEFHTSRRRSIRCSMLTDINSLHCRIPWHVKQVS